MQHNKTKNKEQTKQQKMNKFEEVLAIQLPALPNEGIPLLNNSAALQLTS